MSHAQEYYENYGGEPVARYVERHLRGSSHERERIRHLVELVPEGVRTLLDVGAGHGLFLEALAQQRGLRGTGIEITEAKVAYARSCGVDMRLGDASKLGFGAGSFDAVVCCEVLEHLPFGVYEAALSELARVARRWVIVSVPYDERRHFVTCPYCAASVNPNYHFRSFNADVMAALLPGFALQQTGGLGSEPNGWLKAWLRPWVARGWPALLVCPSCGFRAAPASPSSALSGNGWGARLAKLPMPSRPLWRVALYRRAGAAEDRP